MTQLKEKDIGFISYEQYNEMKSLNIENPDDYLTYKEGETNVKDVEAILLNSVEHIEVTNNNHTLVVIDDFYNDPDAVRDFALTRNFVPRGEHGAIGHRTLDHYHFEGVKERFENILGGKMITGEKLGGWEYQTNGVFQHCMAEDPFVIHADAQQWAAMVYLTPNAPPQCGTSMYRHKESGLDSIGPDDWNLFKGNFYDATPFDLVDKIGNKYNRCVIMDAKLIHAASEYFGDSMMNDRLFQIFFFDTENK
tara:strand:- start:104 stop:856 length:753 start_codon:yes stop_codon:yes gene_type:complete